jgi:hypothetical protein
MASSINLVENQQLKNKMLIIFDINGTLLKKIDKEQSSKIKSDLIFGTRCLRPHAPQLAQFLNENFFDYGFWTTQNGDKAEISYNAILEFGFKNAKLFWKGINCKKRHIKDLSLKAEQFPEYKQENILIIDDSYHKIINRERFIKVKTFHLNELDSDKELLYLSDYLATMKRNLNLNQSNIIEYLERIKFSNKILK